MGIGKNLKYLPPRIAAIKNERAARLKEVQTYPFTRTTKSGIKRPDPIKNGGGGSIKKKLIRRRKKSPWVRENDNVS